jgi:hypothetical protein
MATLWIREYQTIGSAPDVSGMNPAGLQISDEPGSDMTPVTFTTSTQSAAFATTTRFITIIGSAAFHYVVGSNPTATTNALKIPADTLFTISVTAGHKIAAILAA